jgi:hypothetical protein
VAVSRKQSHTVRIGGKSPPAPGPKRLADTEGDVGFRGGARPDVKTGTRRRGKTERVRPKDPGRSGA